MARFKGITVRRGTLGYTDKRGTCYTPVTFDAGVYQYSLADVTECPDCDTDVSDLDVLETCPYCGGNFQDMLANKCGICGTPVHNGWLCLDDASEYCDSCVRVK